MISERESELEFGNVELTPGEKRFGKLLNTYALRSCFRLPVGLQNAAALYFINQSRQSQEGGIDYFANFYGPCWSLLYWLETELAGPDLNPEESEAAATAQAMALHLHSFDNHLADRQEKTSHLKLQMRTVAWNTFTESLAKLGDAVPDGENIIRTEINVYYEAVHNPAPCCNLEEYLELSRRQGATWAIAPMLMALKLTGEPEVARQAKESMEAFLLAYRILDDIQDREEDRAAGKLTAIQLASNLDSLRERIIRELERGARLAEGIGLSGYAGQLEALAKPIEEFLIGGESAPLAPGKFQEPLSLEVTSLCDQPCNYCFALAGLTGKRRMSLEEARDMVGEAYTLGYRKLHLTGGEPVFWAYFFELLEYAQELGYDAVLVNTHGINLGPKNLDRMREFRRILQVTVSLNGPREIHEQTRGPGTYRSVIRGVEALLEREIGLHIFTTLTPALLPLLSAFSAGLYKDYPAIKSLTLIQLHRVINDEVDVQDKLLSPGEFAQAVTIAGLLKQTGVPMYFLDNPLTQVVAGALGLDNLRSPPLLRPGKITVLANGEITGAHSSRSSFGRYRPGKLGEVYQSREYHTSVTPAESECSGCAYQSRCRQAGMLRPSGKHRAGDESALFCKQVNSILDLA